MNKNIIRLRCKRQTERAHRAYKTFLYNCQTHNFRQFIVASRKSLSLERDIIIKSYGFDAQKGYFRLSIGAFKPMNHPQTQEISTNTTNPNNRQQVKWAIYFVSASSPSVSLSRTEILQPRNGPDATSSLEFAFQIHQLTEYGARNRWVTPYCNRINGRTCLIGDWCYMWLWTF